MTNRVYQRQCAANKVYLVRYEYYKEVSRAFNDAVLALIPDGGTSQNEIDNVIMLNEEYNRAKNRYDHARRIPPPWF